ncbi:MAG: FadR/GntR family transcriptional regulator [Caulobacter sp.]
MSETVALEILRDIVSSGKAAGDRLPLESEMLTHYGVSRPSLREALRLLEFQGLIAIRPGPGSSTIVGQATAPNLARMLVLYLHLANATYDELLSSWQMTEPLLARLAAQNPDRTAVQAAMAPFLASAQSPAGEKDRSQAVHFHDVVADLANNKVLALICHGVGAIADEHLVEEGHVQVPAELIRDHAQLAQAIHDGKADEAADLMADHMGRVVAAFRKRWPDKVGEKRWI